MQVDTFLFGKIAVDPNNVITFPAGLPGFEQCRRFTLIHERTDATAPASFTLQSLDESTVAFQITDPTVYGFHYELELSDAETDRLQATDPADIAVMLVLYRREHAPAPIEANFRAPILINMRTRLAMQKVIEKAEPRITLTELSQALG